MIRPVTDMLHGFPPERSVFALEGLEIAVVEGDMPFVTMERDIIRENWQKEIAAKPALFDGQMLLNRSVSVVDGKLLAQAHVVPFSAFMWWRKRQPRAGGIHMFAYPVIESSDGALIAVRMAEHTAGAGQVYFAAGSFDNNDIIDGYCDVNGNMQREVMEETGLDLGDATAGDRFYATHHQGVVALFRVFSFAMAADEIAGRIERHILVAEEDEISEAVVIRSADPSAYSYNIMMLPVLDWYFGRSAKATGS